MRPGDAAPAPAAAAAAAHRPQQLFCKRSLKAAAAAFRQQLQQQQEEEAVAASLRGDSLDLERVSQLQTCHQAGRPAPAERSFFTKVFLLFVFGRGGQCAALALALAPPPS